MKVKLEGKRDAAADIFNFKVTITHEFAISREECLDTALGGPDQLITERFKAEYEKLWMEMAGYQIEQVERTMP